MYTQEKNTLKFDEFIMKVDVERFGCNNLLRNFRFMKRVVEIVMDVWWNNRREEISIVLDFPFFFLHSFSFFFLECFSCLKV